MESTCISVARMPVKTCYEIRDKFALKKNMTSTQTFCKDSVQVL